MAHSSLKLVDKAADAAAGPRESTTGFHIGELAKQTGKSKRALRLYEEQGLLSPLTRSPGGFRLYGRDALEQVRWIGNLQELGLSLQELQDVVHSVQEGAVPRDAMQSVRAVLEERLLEMQAQIGRLNVLRRDLKHTLTYLESCKGCSVEENGMNACQSCGTQNANTPPILRGISRCAVTKPPLPSPASQPAEPQPLKRDDVMLHDEGK